MSGDEHIHLDPLTHVGQSDHPDDVALARRRAGRAVRDLGHALVGHHTPAADLDEATATIDALVGRLSAGRRRDRSDLPHSGQWDGPPADGAEMFGEDERPISGRSSPWGLDLTIRRDGDEVVATTTLRAGHEGAPNRSHGGIVAAMFDDVYGFVLTMLRQPAFTGELSVRYAAGTPIGVPLECRVRLAETQGRKLLMTGELTADGRVVATSKATFIAIVPEDFARLTSS